MYVSKGNQNPVGTGVAKFLQIYPQTDLHQKVHQNIGEKDLLSFSVCLGNKWCAHISDMQYLRFLEPGN